MIRDTAERLVRDASAGAIVRHRDMDSATWAAAVELGWTALPLPEADGGLGGSPSALCAIADELGRGLQVGSFVLGNVLPGQLLAAAPPSDARTALLADLVAGSRSLALADAEPRSRGVGGDVTLRATQRGGGYALDGRKSNVWCTGNTDRLLVTASSEEGELLLVAVPLDAPGLTVRRFKTVDDGQALDCLFASTWVDEARVIAGRGNAFSAGRARAWDLALVAEAAECVGLMKSLVQKTSEYLSTRKQFGQPLAKLQVLRHRLADMALARFRSEALVVHSAEHFDALAPLYRTRIVAASIAKALSGARFVAEQAVQLHGGMGVSEEMPIGRYLRRVLALEASLGTPDFHRGRFGEGDARNGS